MPLSTEDLQRLANSMENHAGSIMPGELANNGQTKLLLGRAVKALRSVAQVSPDHADVAIMPLNWKRDLRDRGEVGSLEAKTPFGTYTIFYDASGASLVFEGSVAIGKRHPNIASAKHAGREHFDERVRGCLVKFPKAQPALWLGRAPAGVWSSGREEISAEHLPAWLEKNYTCTPYYAAPQPLEDPKATVAREALEKSRVAIDDWLNLYASEHCNEARVAEAHARVNAIGTLAYIAEVQQGNREALALLAPANEEFSRAAEHDAHD